MQRRRLSDPTSKLQQAHTRLYNLQDDLSREAPRAARASKQQLPVKDVVAIHNEWQQ